MEVQQRHMGDHIRQFPKHHRERRDRYLILGIHHRVRGIFAHLWEPGGTMFNGELCQFRPAPLLILSIGPNLGGSISLDLTLCTGFVPKVSQLPGRMAVLPGMGRRHYWSQHACRDNDSGTHKIPPCWIRKSRLARDRHNNFPGSNLWRSERLGSAQATLGRRLPRYSPRRWVRCNNHPALVIPHA